MATTGSGRPATKHGFSLAELLVVVGIVAVLLAILLPALGAARRSARAAACLANLQQWGQAFQMYRNSNHGHSLPDGSVRWWELLGPYGDKTGAALLCPEATEPRPGPPDPGDTTYRSGSAGCAYDNVTWRGSYGFNVWVFEHAPPGPEGHVGAATKGADRIPVLSDCIHPINWVNNGNPVPRNLQRNEEGPGPDLSSCCIDRHAMAVNLVFLDGHAERVSLAGLWKLKWSEVFQPVDVVVPRP